jgi:hypothetical protein
VLTGSPNNASLRLLKPKEQIMTTLTINTWAAFQRCLKQPPNHPVKSVVTPEMATKILGLRNSSNRNPKPKKQLEYMADMKAGEWALTGDTLKMCSEGQLRDGQNRLAACIKSGATFDTYVMFGISPLFFDRMDIGKPRTAADLLHGAGVANGALTGAITRWVHLFKTGQVKKRIVFPHREILKLATETYGGDEGVGSSLLHSQARAVYQKSNKNLPLSLTAAFMYVLLDQSPDAARPFIEAWVSKEWNGKFEILAKLDQALQNNRTNGRIHDVQAAAFFVIAWNTYVNKKRYLENTFNFIPSRDEFPEIAK